MPAFQYKSQCYPNATLAFNAWQGDFPTSPDSNGAVWTINTATVNTTTGLISGSLKRSTSTATTSLTSGIQLKPCVTEPFSVFDKMPLNDMVFSACLVFCFLAGVSFSRSRL